MRFIKKGAAVEALQYSGHNGAFLQLWSKGVVGETVTVVAGGVKLLNVDLVVGEWVIRSSDGLYTVATNAEFVENYESL